MVEADFCAEFLGDLLLESADVGAFRRGALCLPAGRFLEHVLDEPFGLADREPFLHDLPGGVELLDGIRDAEQSPGMTHFELP